MSTANTSRPECAVIDNEKKVLGIGKDKYNLTVKEFVIGMSKDTKEDFGLPGYPHGKYPKFDAY